MTINPKEQTATKETETLQTSAGLEEKAKEEDQEETLRTEDQEGHSTTADKELRPRWLPLQT